MRISDWSSDVCSSNLGVTMSATDTLTPAHTEGTASGDLFGDSATPRIALVGTSYSANPDWNFAGALKQQLGEDLTNDAHDGVGPFQPMDNYLTRPDFAPARPKLAHRRATGRERVCHRGENTEDGGIL